MQTMAVVGMSPFLVLLQHNNVTTKEWLDLKHALQREQSLQCFTVKNSVLKGVLASRTQGRSDSVCQGPTVLVGCHTVEQVQGLRDSLRWFPKLIFVTCLSQTGFWTHLDLERLHQTSPSVWHMLITHLKRSAELRLTLQKPLELVPLQTSLFTLVNVLGILQNLPETSLKQ